VAGGCFELRRLIHTRGGKESRVTGKGRGGERSNCSVEQWGIPSKGWDRVSTLWVRVTAEREREREKGRASRGSLNATLENGGRRS